jgi:hypothetical protein
LPRIRSGPGEGARVEREISESPRIIFHRWTAAVFPDDKFQKCQYQYKDNIEKR